MGQESEPFMEDVEIVLFICLPSTLPQRGLTKILSYYRSRYEEYRRMKEAAAVTMAGMYRVPYTSVPFMPEASPHVQMEGRASED